MRNFIFILIVGTWVLSSCEKDGDQSKPGARTDSIAMGQGYASDVFYHLEQGVVSTKPRTGWDIAFRTQARSASIITNAGAGVVLHTYPYGDTSVWNTTFNVEGMESWPAMYNSDTTWNYSAFEMHQLGHPDYGWGIYNMLSHDVIGDSLFVIKLTDGTLKKLWIVKKASVSNIYYLRYANLDGSAEQQVSIPCVNYPDKNFVYFSLKTNEILDREPASSGWDILFTKYVTFIPNGQGGIIPYPVVGVLLNQDLQAQKVTSGDPELDTYSSSAFQTSISTIGYDWKSFNNETFTYEMVPDVMYFIKRPNGDVFKIIFTGFHGSSDGKIFFTVKKVS